MALGVRRNDTTAVLWASSNEQAEAIEQRKQWYKALAHGDDPFTEDVLQALREE
jgi:hypothetical protein